MVFINHTSVYDWKSLIKFKKKLIFQILTNVTLSMDALELYTSSIFRSSEGHVNKHINAKVSMASLLLNKNKQ